MFSAKKFSVDEFFISDGILFYIIGPELVTDLREELIRLSDLFRNGSHTY